MITMQDKHLFEADRRGKISYVDVVMSFGTIVVLMGAMPWIWNAIGMIQQEVDPLTAVILALFVPFMFISLLLSMGVSARSS